ncbi:hypothetical protein [Sneathiella sp.]|uniref:hypothetical protein n=1 Tax=Sneathiella sp. TaxID=1964365 RepID=UPI003565E914
MQIKLKTEDNAVFERLKSSGHITHDLRRVMTQQWNMCSICKQRIGEGRPAFGGYKEDKSPVLVGACCADSLAELATPVYWTGTLDLSIKDSQKLWRYMDFAKLMSMLHQGGLYFTRAENFKDRFEGAAGLSSREFEWDQHYLSFFRTALQTPPPGMVLQPKSEETIEIEAKMLLDQLKNAYSNARNSLVSCWHANDVESEALWHIYCPQETPGLAIQTTVSRLWDSVSEDQSSIVGRVHYLDYRKSFASGDQRIFCKRSSLSHEREVRAIISNDYQNPIIGKILKCELETLIEEIVISPYAPAWFKGVLTESISRFGYKINLRESELVDSPFF